MALTAAGLLITPGEGSIELALIAGQRIRRPWLQEFAVSQAQAELLQQQIELDQARTRHPDASAQMF